MIANQNTLKLAYELIKSKKGNMTRGVSKETLYGISLSVFERLSNKGSVLCAWYLLFCKGRDTKYPLLRIQKPTREGKR